jgi:hypothetical protein
MASSTLVAEIGLILAVSWQYPCGAGFSYRLARSQNQPKLAHSPSTQYKSTVCFFSMTKMQWGQGQIKINKKQRVLLYSEFLDCMK